ncbi:MAG: hypothetical protein KDJ36_05670, partial [Hyphomicrobiaceae bacterium]|nr:hypothetical protein [Hyphomicrobiaceae bacterium]
VLIFARHYGHDDQARNLLVGRMNTGQVRRRTATVFQGRVEVIPGPRQHVNATRKCDLAAERADHRALQ